MENRAYAFFAGLFLVSLAAGLIATGIWFSGDAVEQVDYVLVSRMPVSGLNPKAPVRLRGVDVGKVEDIRFDPKDPHNILIAVVVDRNAPITRSTYAQLGYLGITGLSFVQLDDDGATPERLEPRARIEVRPSTLDRAQQSIGELLADVSNAAKRVTRLLDDKNLAQLSRTLANIQLASQNVGLASQNVQLASQNVSRASRTIAEDLSREARMLDRVLADLHEQPQSLIFGRAAPLPGPGEKGFDKNREGP